MRILVTLLCCFHLANLLGQATKSFQPFPGDSAKLYQFDLYKNFFINDEEEFKERSELVRAFQNLDKKLSTQSKTSNKNSYRLVAEFDSLSKKIGKHFSYLGMFAYIDLSNPIYQMKMDSFNQQLSPILNRINETITTLPLSSITKEKQNLRGPDYRFYYDQLRANPMN
jgi:oligoendopeptidase F